MPKDAATPAEDPFKILSDAFTADNDAARKHAAMLAEICRSLKITPPSMEEKQIRRGMTELQAMAVGAVMGHKNRELEKFGKTIPRKKALFLEEEPVLPNEHRLNDILESAERIAHLTAAGHKFLPPPDKKGMKKPAGHNADGKLFVQASDQSAAEPKRAEPEHPKRTISLPIVAAAKRTNSLNVIGEPPARPEPAAKKPEPETPAADDPRKIQLRRTINRALRRQVGEGKRFADQTAFDQALATLYERFHALDTNEGTHKGDIISLKDDASLTLTPRQALVTGVALGFKGPGLAQFYADAGAIFKDALSSAALGLYPEPNFKARNVEKRLKTIAPLPKKKPKPRQAVEEIPIEDIQKHYAEAAKLERQIKKSERALSLPVREDAHESASPIAPVLAEQHAIEVRGPSQPIGVGITQPKHELELRYRGLLKEEIHKLMEEAREEYKAMGAYSSEKADVIATKLFNGIALHYSPLTLDTLSKGNVNGKEARISQSALHSWRRNREVNLDIVSKGCDALAKNLLPEEAETLANYLAGIPWKEKKTPRELLRFIEQQAAQPVNKSEATSGPQYIPGIHDLIHLARRQERMLHGEYAAKLGMDSSDLSRMAAPANSDKDYAQHRGNNDLDATAKNFGLTETEGDDIALFKQLVRGKASKDRITQEKLVEFMQAPATQAMPRMQIIGAFLEKLKQRHGFHNRGELANAIVAFEQKKNPEAEIVNRRPVLKQKLDNIIKTSGGIMRLPPDMAEWVADFAFPAEGEADLRASFSTLLQEAERTYNGKGNLVQFKNKSSDTGTPG